MRVIKFRAGHKDKRPNCNGCTKRVLLIDFVNQEMTVVIDEDRGTQETWNFRYSDLIEFTGLHDKNGKEIYEGDIITNQLKGRPPFEIKSIMLVYSSYIFEGQSVYDIEIIGNIYENLELLEGTDE